MLTGCCQQVRAQGVANRPRSAYLERHASPC